MKQSAEEWPQTWTAVIGDAILIARTRRKMSAQALSERTKALGYEIPRNTITNLETGRKQTIALHELAVLAAALQVSPLGLTFPPDVVESVEVWPGDGGRNEVFSAALWWVGPVGLRPSVEGLEPLDAAWDVSKLRERLVYDQELLWELEGGLIDAASPADPDHADVARAAQRVQDQRSRVEETLRQLRSAESRLAVLRAETQELLEGLSRRRGR